MHIRMMNIQEVDEQELCRQIFLYVGGMGKYCVLPMQGYTVGCGSNLMDVFVPCEVFSDMNS